MPPVKLKDDKFTLAIMSWLLLLIILLFLLTAITGGLILYSFKLEETDMIGSYFEKVHTFFVIKSVPAQIGVFLLQIIPAFLTTICVYKEKALTTIGKIVVLILVVSIILTLMMVVFIDPNDSAQNFDNIIGGKPFVAGVHALCNNVLSMSAAYIAVIYGLKKMNEVS